MNKQQELVREWNQRVGHPAPEHPAVPSDREAMLCMNLLIEEGVQEFANAVRKGDLTEIADSLGDQLWIVLRTAVVCGIDIEPVFAEIANSNYSKFDIDGNPVPHPTIEGKIGKSDLYEEPDLKPIILKQLKDGISG